MAAASVHNAPDSPPNENGPANPSSMRALRRPLILGLTSSVDNEVTGEAVFIDLGDPLNLLITLVKDHDRKLGGKATSLNALLLPSAISGFPTHARNGTAQSIEEAKFAEIGSVPIEELPMLVTLIDVGDPNSMRRVEPLNLNATFGPGYKASTATIQITEREFSRQFSERLVWYSNPDQATPCSRLTGVWRIVCRGGLGMTTGKL